MSNKVLCVDDDPVILDFYRDYLERQFELETALSGDAALEVLRTGGPFAVLVADMNMPEMNGVELLARAQQANPDTVRIMLTADTERETAVEAINKGHIFQFLTKPCPPEILAFAVESGIRQYQMVVAERELLEKTLSGSIKMLSEVLSTVAPDTFGLGEKARESVRPLAEKVQFDQVWELEIAAMFCGLGYMTIPHMTMERLRSGAALSVMERSLLQRVPEFGRKLLLNVPRLERAAEFVYLQNKHFDGTGFPPVSMDGEKIPLGARLLHLLMDVARLELEGVPKVDAVMKLKQRKGHYDPRLLDAALECFLAERMKNGRAILLKDLRAGHKLLSAVETNEGMMIVPAETTITPMLLEKLNNFTELSAIREPIYIQN